MANSHIPIDLWAACGRVSLVRGGKFSSWCSNVWDRATPGRRPGPGNVVRGWCPAGEGSLCCIPSSLGPLAKLAVIQNTCCGLLLPFLILGGFRLPRNLQCLRWQIWDATVQTRFYFKLHLWIYPLTCVPSCLCIFLFLCVSQSLFIWSGSAFDFLHAQPFQYLVNPISPQIAQFFRCRGETHFALKINYIYFKIKMLLSSRYCPHVRVWWKDRAKRF